MKPEPSANFAFLARHDPGLVALGTRAEMYFADDPNTCLIKLRQFAEQMVRLIAGHVNISFAPREDHALQVKRLRDRKLLSPAADQLFRGLREAGNEANHEAAGNHGEALRQLKNARELGLWFHRTFGNDKGFAPGPFIPPPSPGQQNAEVQKELESLRQQAAAHAAELSQARAALDAETRGRSAELSQAQAALEEASARALEAEARARKEAEDHAVWEALAHEEEDRRNQTEKMLEAQSARIAELLAQAAAAGPELLQRTAEQAAAASDLIELDEADTRRLVDEQLRQAGWEANSQTLRFSSGTRPEKGRKLAIAEWPCGKGRADYVLFVGLRAMGIVEAKAFSIDVPSVLEQARGYAEALTASQGAELVGGPWGELRVPFLFATNGRRFLRQLETRSGIWFLDARRPQNLARPLAGWYPPAGLVSLADLDEARVDAALAAEPTGYLGVRDYQLKAIVAVEKAIAQGRRSCLVAMATGTGKTRMAIGLGYRLLKTGRFRRILFLVDRSALGEQAAGAFKDARLEQFHTFTESFNILEMSDAEPDSETRLHIATVQSMARRVLSAASTEVPPVDQYDCIIVDECHRGYNLDRDMSDAQLGFRDQADYMSTYRRVLDHFDAVKIGLTATPALHTSQIFGPPIYWYTYREAVLDGYLIDHEPPLRIETTLTQKGIHYARGEQVKLRSRSTGLERLATLPDDVDIDIEGFNTAVVTESFNQVVCEQLARHIRVDDRRKTVIFCVDDDHAERVVRLLKLALQAEQGAIPDNAVMKITGSAMDPLRRVRQFKNDELPAIAVTVDLLTTGIDVPAICNLVFLRRVRSRILFAQMLGRATRLCPDVQKETFRIFDAVDIYAALESESDMQPVVTRPNIPVAQLVREIAELDDLHDRQAVLDELVTRLQRKKGHMSPEATAAFKDKTGHTPGELARLLRTMTADQVRSWLADNTYAMSTLDAHGTGKEREVIVHDGPDSHVGTHHVYQGKNKPDEYLKHFADFLREQQNQIPALVAVTTRPRELTRKHLKDLAMVLEQHGFDAQSLRTAWHEKTNADIAAGIIGFVRQAALGEALKPYDLRVQGAVARVIASHPWSDEQRGWLEKIGRTLEKEQVLDQEALDQGAFQSEGGFRRLNKLFDGQLATILGDLNEQVWQNAG